MSITSQQHVQIGFVLNYFSNPYSVYQEDNFRCPLD